MGIYLGGGAKGTYTLQNVTMLRWKERKCCMTQGNQGFYKDNAKKDTAWTAIVAKLQATHDYVCDGK